MSVQLILYPQSKVSDTEILVDGIDFNTVNTSLNTEISSPQAAINYYNPTMTVNAWYRYYNVTGGTSQVYETGETLRLESNATYTKNGIIQKLSNLTIGAEYSVVIDFDSVVLGACSLLVYSGTVLQSTTVLSGATYQIIEFTANSTTDTIVLASKSSSISVTNLTQIASISIKAGSLTPSGDYEGQVILDLYEDEDIPLTLSVDNFKNVAEKVQSYSKAFNLPATKRNNQIFTNLFEVTMVQDAFSFNPYKQTRCVLKQNGFILFEGYLRLIDIQDKEAEISYNVNLYSEVIALADTLKDKKFRDLKFTELTHEYNKTQIKYSWNDGVTASQLTPITWTNSGTSGFRTDFNTLKYPFVDWSHQYTRDATTGYPILPNLESSFRPFINIKYLIDRIFADTDFTWTSNFFNTTDFGKLFMDFNWGADNAPVVFTTSATSGFPSYISYTTGVNNVDFPFTSISDNFGYSTGIFTAQADNQIYNITYSIEMMSAAGGPYSVICEWIDSSGGVYNQQTLTPALVGSSFYTFYSGSFSTPPLQAGDTLICRFTVLSGTITIINNQPNSFTGTTSAFNTTDDTLLGTLRGELGQWDFLKGILTMFNIISMPDPDNPNNIRFEPYNDIFITDPNIVTHDWTDKVDVSEMKLTPLTDLNKKTIFKFVEDDDDYAFNLYKNSVGGHLYGSKVYDASGFTILDGEDEIVAEPFAATVVKPLDALFANFIVPTIYSYNSDDDTTEGFDNSPRIMYNNGIKDTSITYYIPAQNGVGDEDEDEYLQFSHIKDGGLVISAYADYHFGECQLLTNQASTTNNLFNLYWLSYYSELYNPNTRTMTLKVSLNPSDINTFKFNDKVFIKNRNYRVNKIDYKPNDLATVEFILLP